MHISVSPDIRPRDDEPKNQVRLPCFVAGNIWDAMPWVKVRAAAARAEHISHTLQQHIDGITERENGKRLGGGNGESGFGEWGLRSRCWNMAIWRAKHIIMGHSTFAQRHSPDLWRIISQALFTNYVPKAHTHTSTHTKIVEFSEYFE